MRKWNLEKCAIFCWERTEVLYWRTCKNCLRLSHVSNLSSSSVLLQIWSECKFSKLYPVFHSFYIPRVTAPKVSIPSLHQPQLYIDFISYKRNFCHIWHSTAIPYRVPYSFLYGAYQFCYLFLELYFLNRRKFGAQGFTRISSYLVFGNQIGLFPWC